MEPNEFYVYPGTYFMCGGCGSSMAPVYPQQGRWKYKLYCGNPNCPKYLVIFELGEEARIPIFDTGERAPDPRTFQNRAVGVTMGQLAEQPIDPVLAGNIHNLGRDRDETNFIPGTVGLPTDNA
jgi:hypothetical protein